MLPVPSYFHPEQEGDSGQAAQAFCHPHLWLSPPGGCSDAVTKTTYNVPSLPPEAVLWLEDRKDCAAVALTLPGPAPAPACACLGQDVTKKLLLLRSVWLEGVGASGLG